jgi:hypothetical protein
MSFRFRRLNGKGRVTHQDWTSAKCAEKKVSKTRNEPTMCFRISKPSKTTTWKAERLANCPAGQSGKLCRRAAVLQIRGC